MNSMLFQGIALGGLIVAIYVGFRCFFRVEEGHVAILTSFGAAQFEDDAKKNLRTFDPGLHTKAPWAEVHTAAIMEQSLDLAGESGGRSAMANDGTVLRFDSALRFVPVREGLYTYLFGLRQPTPHITGLFTSLLRNEIANFRPDQGSKNQALVGTQSIVREDFNEPAGSYALIRRQRSTLNDKIEQFCHQKIGPAYGVQFHAVDLVDVLPPEELKEALNAVANARAEANASYFRAEAEARQRLLAAEQGVAIAHARAQAVEAEIDRLAESLMELHTSRTLSTYVERRRAEVLAESRALFMKEALS